MRRATRRRHALATLGALVLSAGSPALRAQAPVAGSAGEAAPVGLRRIPSTGEAMPVIGLGTWITFNVGNDPVARANAAEVMRAFLAGGGRMIDSSPMYGSSQEVVGDGLARLGRPAATFSADKVWIGTGGRGRAQIETSRKRWGVTRLDLVQVHNLLAGRSTCRSCSR
jgi:diketogulonate reductase-like aldo/keto reductase